METSCHFIQSCRLIVERGYLPVFIFAGFAPILSDFEVGEVNGIHRLVGKVFCFLHCFRLHSKRLTKGVFRRDASSCLLIVPKEAILSSGTGIRTGFVRERSHRPISNASGSVSVSPSSANNFLSFSSWAAGIILSRMRVQDRSKKGAEFAASGNFSPLSFFWMA